MIRLASVPIVTASVLTVFCMKRCVTYVSFLPQMWTNLLNPVILFMCSPVFANILFLPRGGIYASFDHWTLHFPVETRTSWTFANKLEYRIRIFKSKFSSNFAEHRQQIPSDLADRIWGKFMRDSDLLDRELNATIDALKHLKTSDPIRAKRSLLPFVGDALSSLFGTATSTEIQDILSRVNDLSDSRDDMLNVLDNTVTMVNETIVDVSTNRRTINRLTNVTNYLTGRLELLKNVVLNDYFASDLESDMDSVFTDLITMVKEFRKSVMDLETIFSLTENGILPRSFLPPSRFAKILDDIQKVLPRELALPFAPSDTDKYYSTSHTQTMRTDGGISVLVTIPLLSISDHFNVFQIFNVPVPKSIDEQNYVANYEVEKAKFVAISEDSLKFIFINDNDFHLYLRRKLPFCPIRRPIVNVLTSTMCLPALLTNQTDKVTQFCEKVVHVNRTVDPTAQYLGNGHWIVVSAKPLDLEIRCKSGMSVNSTSVVRTVFPLSLVKLNFGCAAFGHHFQLPTHFRTDSRLELLQIYHLNQTIDLNDVWTHVSNSLAENKVSLNQVVKTLPPIRMKTISLSVLKAHIKELKSQSHYRTVTVSAISVTSVAVLVALVLVTVKCVHCPSVNLIRFPTRVTSPSNNPTRDLTVDMTELASTVRTTETQQTPQGPVTTPTWLRS